MLGCSMKAIVFMTVVVFLLNACTTLKPIELTPTTVQQRISSGDLIQIGNKYRITTSEEKQYYFIVTSIDSEYICGKDIKIPTKDILRVEKRAFSMGKTVGLAASIIVSFMSSVYLFSDH
jgi:hypothetical protein